MGGYAVVMATTNTTSALTKLLARNTYAKGTATARKCATCRGTGNPDGVRAYFGGTVCRTCAGSGVRGADELTQGRDDKFASDLIRTFGMDWDCLVPIVAIIASVRVSGAATEQPLESFADGWLQATIDHAAGCGFDLVGAITKYI